VEDLPLITLDTAANIGVKVREEVIEAMEIEGEMSLAQTKMKQSESNPLADHFIIVRW
jgi:hypothetical protein